MVRRGFPGGGGMQLATELNRARYQARGQKMVYSADGEPEGPEYFYGARSRDFTMPLRSNEKEPFGWAEFWR